jgi:hypothetical protein
MMAYRAEKLCWNNTGINNCCFWMFFLILANRLSLGSFCWLDILACNIPKLICETTNLGTFVKTPWLQYQPVAMLVSTHVSIPPPSTEQSKTGHALKFGDTARIELSRVEKNRSYLDTELQFHLTRAVHCDIYTGIINEKMHLSLQHHDAVPLFNSGKNPAAFRFSTSMCGMLEQQWIIYIHIIRITSKPSFLLDRLFVSQGPTNFPYMQQIRLYSRR